VPQPPEATAGAEASGRPLRRDARRNREVVLAAARRMFAEHGADCSFEDIAREAGVGVGTVYRRFPDRRTLIEAILEQRIVDVDDAAAAALRLDDPWAATRFFVGAAARMQVEDRGLRELLHDHRFISAGLALLRRRITPAAEELARRLRDDGTARTDLTGQDLVAVIRMLGSLGPGTADPADPPEPPAGFERYLDLVLDALRREDSTRR
jgi:AcrR family transcriptional regulator